MTNITPTDITPETLAAIRGDDTAEGVAARLRALDDETMLFDGPATYALIAEAADLIEAQAAGIARLKLDAIAVQPLYSRRELEDRATKAEAALATLSAIPVSAASVVATLLTGADAGSYGAVVTACVAARRGLADMTAERDEALAQMAAMREASHGDAALTALDRQIVATALRMMAENIGRMGRARGDLALGVLGGTGAVIGRCVAIADQIYPEEQGKGGRNG